MPVTVQSAWLLSSAQADKSKLAFFRDVPTNMLFVEAQLEEQGAKLLQLNQTHAEIIAQAQSGILNSLASVVSPYGHLAGLLGLQATMACGAGYSGQGQFLMVRKHLVNDQRVKSLEQAVVRAWNEILFDPKAAQISAKALMSDPEICFQLAIEGGFSSFRSSFA